VVKQLGSHEEEKETFKSLKIGLLNAQDRL
jgi:hypothetical protein